MIGVKSKEGNKKFESLLSDYDVVIKHQKIVPVLFSPQTRSMNSLQSITIKISAKSLPLTIFPAQQVWGYS